jgi:alpha 1,2-mannosyltransferase
MTNSTIIYLLISNRESVEEFKESLALLRMNFLDDYPYPVTAFIENNFDDSWRSEILGIYENVNFSKIKFSIPEFNLDLDIPEFFPHPTHGNGPVAWGHPGFSLGYRHMCRFMSGDIYRNAELLKYDFYMRLDTDSYILSKLTIDPFQIMSDGNYNYGYNNTQKDNPKVVENLFEISEKYIDTHEINRKSSIEYPMIYYTNFEIGRVQWFIKSGYMDFFDHLDLIGGIYTKRWGDAPIRYIGVQMLMGDSEKINFESIIDYKHGKVREIEKKLNYN